jgi:hypothetical protein
VINESVVRSLWNSIFRLHFDSGIAHFPKAWMFTKENETEAIICVRASVGVGVNGVNMMDIHYTESSNDSETDSENVDSDNDDTDNDDTDTLPIEPSDDAADCDPPAKHPRVG